MTKQNEVQKHLDNLSELAQANTLHHEDGTEFNIYDLKELMSDELEAIEEIQVETEESLKQDNGMNNVRPLTDEELKQYEETGRLLKEFPENEKESVLTSEELEKMGARLADEYKTLELMISSINLASSTREITNDERGVILLKYDALYKLTDTMLYKLQDTAKELDKIAFLLMDNDNAKEIEGARGKLI